MVHDGAERDGWDGAGVSSQEQKNRFSLEGEKYEGEEATQRKV